MYLSLAIKKIKINCYFIFIYNYYSLLINVIHFSMLYKTSFYKFLANITVDGSLSLTANRFGTEWSTLLLAERLCYCDYKSESYLVTLF